MGLKMESLALVLLAFNAQISTAQKQLTTATFEHTTQAATGMTTGVWLVRFCSPSISACASMQGAWTSLAEELLGDEDEEEQIFLADVDIATSPEVAARFGVLSAPRYILLRNRRMYTRSARASIDELRYWATSGWHSDLEMQVPPEKESFDVVAAVMGVVSRGKQTFHNIFAATQSDDPAVQLQARAQLALPVLLSCLIALLVMLVKVRPTTNSKTD